MVALLVGGLAAVGTSPDGGFIALLISSYSAAVYGRTVLEEMRGLLGLLRSGEMSEDGAEPDDGTGPGQAWLATPGGRVNDHRGDRRRAWYRTRASARCCSG